MKSKGKLHINKLIIITIFSIIIVLLIAIIMRTLFRESDASGSNYDEIFISMNDDVTLKSMELSEIQIEILEYVKEWKDVSGLSYVDVYLDNELKLTKMVFVYELDDVKNYLGRLEVNCDAKNETWKMVNAKSVYYYSVDDGSSTVEAQLCDVLLDRKIDEVISYIKTINKPRVDMYLLRIDENSVYIDAHNLEDNVVQYWSEKCIFQYKDDVIFIESEN